MPVQQPEILLDLSEIRQQVARHLRELLKTVLERSIVKQPNVAAPNAGGASARNEGRGAIEALGRCGSKRQYLTSALSLVFQDSAHEPFSTAARSDRARLRAFLQKTA